MVDKDIVINSPEFWDLRYTQEVRDGFSRADVARWQLITSQITEKDKVLEFGCGLGEYIEWLARERPYCSFAGIDISKVAIDYCQKRMPNFEWLVAGELIQIPLEEEEKKKKIYDYNYNVIVCQHTYEHLTEENQRRFMEQAYSILPVGGRVVLVIPINDAEWFEHPKIYTLEDMRKLVRECKPKWESIMLWRPNTCFKRADNHNDGDFEEALVFMKKR